MAMPALLRRQETAHAMAAPSPVTPPAGQRPDDSARGAILAGLLILAVFFGGFGTWAALAPLNGAVIGEAVVKVEGNRKSIQHLEGGIVREIRVREGQRVEVGDTLLVLDDIRLKAERDALWQTYVMLRATGDRLMAELAGSATITFHPDLLAAKDDPAAASAMAGQGSEFDNRRVALAGSEQILQQRIAQNREQIAGFEAQLVAYRAQLDSVAAEKQSLQTLLDKGLITRPRVLQLDRTEAGLEAQVSTSLAAIANARQTIGEIEEQIAQLRKARIEETGRELRDVQSKLAEVGPRLLNADVALGRSVIRTPYAGRVVDLNVFSVGGVIGQGQRLLDVVPDEIELVVEARIHVEDIADVRPGMAAEVHFTSYKQRSVPLIHGRVSKVSADRLTDERTGIPYYVVEVAVSRDELAASPQIQLYPGMPALAMITTEARTALDYLLGPLTASFDRSFRQK